MLIVVLIMVLAAVYFVFTRVLHAKGVIITYDTRNLLAIIVLAPVVLLMVFRINAALVFLSLCLGDVLVRFTANDASSFLTTFSSSHTVTSVTTSNSNIKIALLLLPVMLTSIFMIRTVQGSTRLMLNALPAAGVGLLGRTVGSSAPAAGHGP